jgi:hypothetical protein
MWTFDLFSCLRKRLEDRLAWRHTRFASLRLPSGPHLPRFEPERSVPCTFRCHSEEYRRFYRSVSWHMIEYQQDILDLRRPVTPGWSPLVQTVRRRYRKQERNLGSISTRPSFDRRPETAYSLSTTVANHLATHTPPRPSGGRSVLNRSSTE